MATQLGSIKADGVNVSINVSEHFSLTRIHQDSDTVFLAGLESLQELIKKLQEAESLIIAAQKEEIDNAI